LLDLLGVVQGGVGQVPLGVLQRLDRVLLRLLG